MALDEESKNVWLLYFPEFNTLFEEKDKSRYEEALRSGIIDVSDSDFYTQRYKEEQISGDII